MADSKLKIDIRRSKILEGLRRDGKVYVSKLSQELGATSVTIRNDLAALERDGYLIRMQGGAVRAVRAAAPDFAPGGEPARFEAEKRAIAASIAELVRDGETLFINSGTTTQYVAAALKLRRNLNIVTNSLSVALALGAVPTFHVLLLGGEINAQYGFTYGGDAQEQLRRYHADEAILSIDGICAESGISTCLVEEAIIDRIMLEQSKRMLIAADHSKVGRAGFTNIRKSVSGILLVTDRGNDAETLKRLEECGVEITIG